MSEVDPHSLDLATLSWLAGSAANEFLLAAIRAAGHPQLRISHGYVFQLLIGGPKNIGVLATELGVTQQAASKVVAELTAFGYLTALASPTDRRVRQIALSKRGEGAIAVARAARADLDAKLRATLDDETIAGARSALAALLEATGGTETTRHRRVRQPKLD